MLPIVRLTPAALVGTAITAADAATTAAAERAAIVFFNVVFIVSISFQK